MNQTIYIAIHLKISKLLCVQNAWKFTHIHKTISTNIKSLKYNTVHDALSASNYLSV